MAVENSLTERKGSFVATLSTKGYQNMLKTALRDEKKITRFVTAITAAVSANSLLKECTPESIVNAGLQGEALGLSPSPTLGEYYIVPYKKNKKIDGAWKSTYEAQFQIGTAGRVALAMRSGLYKELEVIDIRQGEYRGRNNANGKPYFIFAENDEEREKLPIVGYLAYFTLTNGFHKEVYWSKTKCLLHAARYSKAFDKDLYDKKEKGERLTAEEQRVVDNAPWYKNTEEMCENLVLRRLLKNAPRSVEISRLEEIEIASEAEAEAGLIAEQVKDAEVNDFFDSESDSVPPATEAE